MLAVLDVMLVFNKLIEEVLDVMLEVFEITLDVSDVILFVADVILVS